MQHAPALSQAAPPVVSAGLGSYVGCHPGLSFSLLVRLSYVCACLFSVLFAHYFHKKTSSLSCLVLRHSAQSNAK